MTTEEVLDEVRRKEEAFKPPHYTEAFCDVCAAIELLEPEQQCRVLNAAAKMFGLVAHVTTLPK